MEFNGRSLLIVDDNEDLRDIAQEVLTSEGYRVRTVARAEAALQVFDEDAEDIDLVLTNVFLPGMTGIELADRLREQGRDVRIVLSSGWTARPELQNRLAQGDVDFLTRPFSVEGLTNQIFQSFRKSA